MSIEELPPGWKPDPKMVEALEEMLELARQGRVHSMACVFLCSGRLTRQLIHTAEEQPYMQLVGACGVLYRDLLDLVPSATKEGSEE